LADPARHRLALVWGMALVAAALARGRPSGRRVGWTGAGLLATVGIASSVSPARSEGRDAVRVVGQTALLVPQCDLVPRGTALWNASVLNWGPLYEPHRHPEGALLGGRLALRPETYRVVLDAQDLASGGAPLLDVWPEGAAGQGPAKRRSLPFRRESGGFAVDFDVHPSERAVTLRLRGGGALLLRHVLLDVQPFGVGPV
ncbi:MAG TPA: hypothetical protein VLL75_11185, partial [Vicinamibacteria bacterium]|nr:hypothetical protein [Vicinamibacteria bacterium]